MNQMRLCFPLLFMLVAVACSPAKKSSKSGTSGGSQVQLRQKIAGTARKHLGSEYKYAGKNPKTGFDCSGFTSYVLGQYNVKVSPASSRQATEGRKVSLERVQPGDLVFFGEKGKVTHVALVLKRDRKGIFCIHSTTSRGVVEENINESSYWEPKILFARDVISR